jgi:GNAT superfamily N-acetyltransferase
MAHLYGWAARPAPAVHPLLVRERGRALAGGLSIDLGDTAGIYLVATARAARRRGLASAVMWGLLREARARGVAAAVLQSTPMGLPLYQHLGLREVDRWTNWVRRAG